MTQRKWNNEQLKKAVKENFCYAGVLRDLGLQPAGGNYQSIKRFIKQSSLDISHFTFQGHNRGKILKPHKDLSFYLVKGKRVNSNYLRRRLIKEGVFKSECAMCGRSKWLNKPISLELHHIDGEFTNNELSNLSLLCPNCHATTKTYRGRKKKERFKCSKCDNPVSRKGTKLCKSCAAKLRESDVWKDRPPLSIIKKQVEKLGYSAVGRLYGVSDNAVRHWFE